MNTILTIIIILLFGYLIIKYCFKSKEEKFGNTTPSVVIKNIKKKINMDTLYEYWISLKQWNKEEPNVIQAYEDQKYEIYYGAYNTSGSDGKYDPNEDYLKQLRGYDKLLWNISELNKWWNNLDDKHNNITDEVKKEDMRLKIIEFKNTPYILMYKSNIEDALIFSVELEDPTLTDKNKFQLLFENCSYKENPFVLKSYFKKLKKIMFDYVWSAEMKMMGTRTTSGDLDYFKQVDKDVIDYSESDLYLNGIIKQEEKDFYSSNFDLEYQIGKLRRNKRLGLKKIFVERLKERLSNFIETGKPSDGSLNASDKSLNYYNWLTEYDNYWLRLPDWVKEYGKYDSNGDLNNESMFKVHAINRVSIVTKMEMSYVAALGRQSDLTKLTEFHKKVPPRVKSIKNYRDEFNARFRLAYEEAMGDIKNKIDEAKDRNSLVKFRNESEKDELYQGFFGISNGITETAIDANTIIDKFWFRFDALTGEQIEDTQDRIKEIVTNADPGVSVFFELLQEWESMKKTPTKFIFVTNSKGEKEPKKVIDQDYKYENWITRLHTNDRVVTKFNSPIDNQSRTDEKNFDVYNLYDDELNSYKNVELEKLKTILKCEKDGEVIGLGSETGINNINVVFNESYFRKFIFEQKEEYCKKNKQDCKFLTNFKYRNTYNLIISEWNNKFTEFALACFPTQGSISSVEFSAYKKRWMTIRESKFYDLLNSSNRIRIGRAYTSNPSVKTQVIHEIKGIVSLPMLEIFLNMLPEQLQKDQEVQETYAARVVQSVEGDMKDYTTMVFLIHYWIGLKDIFKVGGVKTLFHTIAKELMKKDVLGILKNKTFGYTLSNTKEGGLWGVREVCAYWERIMIYDIINEILDYINMIKQRIRLLFPIECNNKTKVSTLVNFWKNHHKFVRGKFRGLTWSTFYNRLKFLYTKDMDKFTHYVQYKNLIEYWEALDKMVRGQNFAWPKFFKIFKNFMIEKIKIATSTQELQDEIWKYHYLLKYSSDAISSYGRKYNTLQLEEDMAENVSKLTKYGECPGHHPYAYSVNESTSPNYCCKHDPYFDQPTGTVKCDKSIDCPSYSGTCYMHTTKWCTRNSDCMSYGDSEEQDAKVKCLKEQGACVYCPLGRKSPVGSPLCQWGNNRPENYVEPVPTFHPKIIP